MKLQFLKRDTNTGKLTPTDNQQIAPEGVHVSFI